MHDNRTAENIDRGSGDRRNCVLQNYKLARFGHENRPKGEAKNEAGEGAYIAGTEYEKPVPTAH